LFDSFAANMSCGGACAKRLMIASGGIDRIDSATAIHFVVARIFSTRSTTIADVTCFMQA